MNHKDQYGPFGKDEDFKVVNLTPPRGGLCYMKRIDYLNDPKYKNFPQFIVARGRENLVGIFFPDLEGGSFIGEMALEEFDRVFEID